MFCSVFCNAKNYQEATKPSAMMDVIVDEQSVATVSASSSSSSFPHLEHLNQPSEPLGDDDVSIAEKDLFEPALEMEPSPSKEPKDEQQVVLDEESSIHKAQPIAEDETTPLVSKEEFVSVLKKIEKENEWHEKRQAKKTAGGKKKRRRNNKNKKGNTNNKTAPAAAGLQERSKKARINGPNATTQAASRMPLASRV